MYKLSIEDILDYYGLEYDITAARNANFKCPFHRDTNPSCGMHVNTGLWKCFGCAMQGNLVSFVAEIESISRDEAEQRIRKTWIDKNADLENIQEIVNKILDGNKDNVQVDPRLPDWVLMQYSKNWDYMKSRGFNEETLEYFEVMYEPKYKLQAFPVRDDEGKLVGITGRQTQPNAEPRYYPVLRFRKSNFLYNFHRVDVSKSVIAVEGEINCMAMHQHGFTNTIAFLGAGISEEQINKVARSGIKELIMFFDTDEAGQKGMLKIWQKLWLQMKITVVPDHEGDPADMDTSTAKSLVDSAELLTAKL